MTKNLYRNTIKQARSSLSPTEQVFSSILHLAVIEVVLNSLEKTFFRITPMLIALTSSVIFGVFIILVCFVFNYQMLSLTVLIYVFTLGFIIGLVFEYVRNLVRQK